MRPAPLNGPTSPKHVRKAHRPSPDIHLVRFHYHNPGDLQLRLLHCATARLLRWLHPDLPAPYWRLYLHSESGALLGWNGRRVPLDPDRAWLIAPDTHFGTVLEKEVTQFFVHFTLTPAFTTGPGVYSTPLTAAMRELHAAASGETAEHAPEQAVIARNALVLLALRGLPEGVLRERALDARVARVLERMEDDPTGRHALPDLAALAGMHPRAFIRLFREETGMTPMACLRARRVSMACDLLHHSNHSIDEIATLTGFYDRYHFSKAFRQLREVTPVAFRRLLPSADRMAAEH